jgi:hypothetical protein
MNSSMRIGISRLHIGRVLNAFRSFNRRRANARQQKAPEQEGASAKKAEKVVKARSTYLPALASAAETLVKVAFSCVPSA